MRRTIHIMMTLEVLMVSAILRRRPPRPPGPPTPPRPPGAPDPGKCNHNVVPAEGGGKVCTKCGTYWPPHD